MRALRTAVEELRTSTLNMEPRHNTWPTDARGGARTLTNITVTKELNVLLNGRLYKHKKQQQFPRTFDTGQYM
jgi:hypothetical protein